MDSVGAWIFKPPLSGLPLPEGTHCAPHVFNSPKEHPYAWDFCSTNDSRLVVQVLLYQLPSPCTHAIAQHFFPGSYFPVHLQQSPWRPWDAAAACSSDAAFSLSQSSDVSVVQFLQKRTWFQVIRYLSDPKGMEVIASVQLSPLGLTGCLNFPKYSLQGNFCPC